MESFQPLWLLFISLAIVLIVVFYVKQSRRKRFDVRKITLRDIDRMDGIEFEDYIAVAFASAGFQTYQTLKSRDFGADLYIINDEEKRVIVQVKRYNAKLGLSCVQEAYAAQVFYGADQSMVITSAEGVTDSCWQLASKTNTSFLLRADLEELTIHLRKGRLEEAYWLLASPHHAESEKSTPALTLVDQTKSRIQAGDFYYK
ncbi:restriction system protein [Alkalihalobacillus xiaoxiensis]|uniref:Restriction system protein n=1 Tax=Shouchella xiaoxiensis TaxID=766895 RepID=A0ABS2SSA2_9BACI|nr:restriction system protein [Shouchella xiaoxiensis]